MPGDFVVIRRNSSGTSLKSIVAQSSGARWIRVQKHDTQRVSWHPQDTQARAVEECWYVCAYSIRLRLYVTEFLSEANSDVPIPQVLWADFLGEVTQ